MVRRTLAATAALVLLLAGVAAAANIDVLHTLRLTSGTPGKAAGVKLSVSQKPTPAGQQPPVVRKLKVTLPKGSKIDTAALARCATSDAELKAQGDAGCPAETKLGSGTAKVYLGGPVVDAKLSMFNRKAGFAVVVRNGATVLSVIPGKLSGTRAFRITLPKVPLGPGEEASVVKLTMTIPRHVKGKHAWVRTPKSCPRSKRWVSLYEPTFDAPHGTEHLTAKTVCRR